MSTLPCFHATTKRWFGLRFALGALLSAVVLSAQPQTHRAETQTDHATMNSFVLIFRQNPARERTPAENQELAAQMRPWAQRQNADGRKLDPRILARESERIGANKGADVPPGAWPITALLFVEARDLADATRVAESHPGLKYGVTVEIRPWGPPAPTQPSPANGTRR